MIEQGWAALQRGRRSLRLVTRFEEALADAESGAAREGL